MPSVRRLCQLSVLIPNHSWVSQRHRTSHCLYGSPENNFRDGRVCPAIKNSIKQLLGLSSNIFRYGTHGCHRVCKSKRWRDFRRSKMSPRLRRSPNNTRLLGMASDASCVLSSDSSCQFHPLLCTFSTWLKKVPPHRPRTVQVSQRMGFWV